MLICPCCGAVNGDRELAKGRCGKCASFFTGQEEVTQISESLVPEVQVPEVQGAVQLSGAQAPHPQVSPTASIPSLSPPVDTSQSDAKSTQLGSPSSSEELIRPRRLSPQFQRHVMMTWQPAVAPGLNGAERTLSSRSPADTKQNYSSLNIGTRKIAPDRNKGSGDYQLNEIIGEGSMGNVWSARQSSLDRNVAVKVPKPELANAGSIGESQFISEVVVTGKLEHPNIVPIYELGRDTNGVPFYSMKHVQGHSWNELIGEKSEQENIEILMKVCDAIAFAHDRDFLHRDIKPHNVMVGEFGEVSVMDWGIAVSLSKDPQREWAATATGPAGTPAYMAPEMAAFNPAQLGVVSDVYLLGAVLYEIVTGTPPHPRTGDTNEALLAAASNEIIPTSETGELVDIARRAMATNVEDRYQNVQAFQDALREYRSHGESNALAASADKHLARAKREENSDEYARARFAYEEALRLWPGNLPALQGLRAATLAHAHNALAQENYELGISLLDSKDPEHRGLLASLKTSRAARQRQAWFTRVAAATAILAIIAVVIVTAWKNKQLESTNQELDVKRLTAERAELDAKRARVDAESAKAAAEKSEVKAVGAKNAALKAKDEARQSEAEARQEELKAAEASYISDIGLAAESIRRNSFANARAILSGLAPRADSTSTRSQLRHVEWGLLQRASTPEALQNLLPNERIQAVASSVDGSVRAAGTADGHVLLWLGKPGDAAEGHVSEPVKIAHGSSLSALALSEKGDYLATAGIDPDQIRPDGEFHKYLVKLWEVKQGIPQPLPILLSGHTAEVLSVVFSQDTSRVLTSAADRTAVVWQRSTGQRLATMRDHLEKRVWSARFSPNEQSIVTACDDGRVRVWQLSPDSPTPAKTHDFRGHEGPVYAAVFSRDAQSVISGGYDRRLLRWHFTPVPVATTTEPPSDLRALLDDTAVDATQAEQIGTEEQQHAASIRAVAVGLLDGKEYIATGSNDNTVRIWQPSQTGWELSKILRGHGRWVQTCAFSNSGKSILSGAYDGVKFWDWRAYSMPRELYPNSEQRVGNVPSELGSSAASKAIYSLDGRWVATAYANGTVGVWDVNSREQAGDRAGGQLLADGHSFLTATGSFYAEGSRLLTSAGDNTTRLWDVARGTPIKKLEGTGWRGTAAVAWREQESSALIVTGSDNRLVPAWLWRVQDGMPVTKQPLLADYAQDRLTLLTGDALSPARDTAAPAQLVGLRPSNIDKLQRLARRIPDVTVIVFSASGERLLIGNSEGMSFLYHVAPDSSAPRLVAKLGAEGAAVRTAVFLPSGASVITASVEGYLKQWDAAQGQLLRQLPWSAPVTSLAVSRDGKFLLVGYAPVEGKEVPVARLFDIENDEVQVSAEFLRRNPTGSRNWEQNQPIVQSVQFVEQGHRALLGLFFPAKKGGDQEDSSASLPSGYQLGYWNCSDDENDFQPLTSAAGGEISATAFGQGATESQLLVVGGKGARLLNTAADDENFTRLTASFRPATAITSIDFSFDPVSRSSTRLVAGDSEGNIRVWELVAGVWSESSGAAAHLTGQHSAPLIATCFDPQRPDRLLTADKTAKINLWTLGQHWTAEPLQQANNQGANCALFSPDGDRIFLGAENNSQLWQRSAQGQYELSEPLQTGTVQTATFSADGNWIVSADGDRSVAFWDRGGQSMASLAEDVTSVALSWDRRRLITGHRDKRVVVWDTSRLVDAPLAEPSENGKVIKELLTLEEHRRGVTSATLSPDGRHLLSAGEEGRTIISAGDPIAPISMTLSRSGIVYANDPAGLQVDAWAVISDPSRSADFSKAEFTATLQGDAIQGERLTLQASAESSGPIIETADETGLVYRPHPTAASQRIGTIVSNAERGVRVALNEAADASKVQTLLRSLTYEIRSDNVLEQAAGNVDRALQEKELANTVRQRTVAISLTGIQYRDLPSAAKDAYHPVSLQAEILIDVDPNPSQDRKSNTGP